LIGYIFILISELRSVARTGEDQYSTLQTLTYYYGGSVQFFEECITKIKIEYTYGFSTLRGFFAPFFGVFKLFGLDSPEILENANAYLAELHLHILNISPTKTYNSFATCFFQFYCDFGIIGIVFLSFCFGFYAQSLYNKLIFYKNKRSEATYVFFFANIMMLSFVNIGTVLALTFWPLVLVRFLYPVRKHKIVAT
jgi:oligosaccharide repeat unit polymerase